MFTGMGKEFGGQYVDVEGARSGEELGMVRLTTSDMGVGWGRRTGCTADVTI
jgi:hypothetical protein